MRSGGFHISLNGISQKGIRREWWKHTLTKKRAENHSKLQSNNKSRTREQGFTFWEFFKFNFKTSSLCADIHGGLHARLAANGDQQVAHHTRRLLFAHFDAFALKLRDGSLNNNKKSQQQTDATKSQNRRDKTTNVHMRFRQRLAQRLYVHRPAPRLVDEPAQHKNKKHREHHKQKQSTHQHIACDFGCVCQIGQLKVGHVHTCVFVRSFNKQDQPQNNQDKKEREHKANKQQNKQTTNQQR